MPGTFNFLSPPELGHAAKIKTWAESVQRLAPFGSNSPSPPLPHGLSATHFRRLFKAVYSISPSQYVIQTRLTKAASELRTTQRPIKQIAAECGIKDVFYFSRLFKSRYVSGPKDYRERSFLT